MAIGQKTGGRKRGTPNKTTATVREALSLAFEGVGGVPKLIAWAKKEPTAFYGLWARMLPTELNARVAGDSNHPLEVVSKIERVIIDPREGVADRDAEICPTVARLYAD
jgi:hypothetical protein